MEIRNFINGSFINSISKQNIREVNPANQTDVGFIDEAHEEEIELAFDAASKAYQRRILQDMDPIRNPSIYNSKSFENISHMVLNY